MSVTSPSRRCRVTAIRSIPTRPSLWCTMKSGARRSDSPTNSVSTRSSPSPAARGVRVAAPTRSGSRRHGRARWRRPSTGSGGTSPSPTGSKRLVSRRNTASGFASRCTPTSSSTIRPRCWGYGASPATTSAPTSTHLISSGRASIRSRRSRRSKAASTTSTPRTAPSTRATRQ